jgi:hypothetical protein
LNISEVHGGLGECDFEVDMCDWYIPNDIYFNWNRTTGDSTLQFAPKQGRPGGISCLFLFKIII